ncbi:alpha/beta hydrolase [Skermanella mucosa]|uniref:alpha/beta hydrolase n=1 Tax=Skermanella mucosa TaxID=1789672 RepID=UPI00192C0871|nr:alpha/beta hydrolase [Skermanella mucosa]UEM21789.1 alpha/beta hydrolase [Skermanella mucosa]
MTEPTGTASDRPPPRMPRGRRRLALLLASLLAAGCTASPAERGSAAAGIAAEGGLARSTLRSGGFDIAVWSRFDKPGEPVHVYVEGDGYAWSSPSDPSSDPTPLNPMALRLAARDGGPNVLYLARPCQFRPAGSRDSCEPAFWTSRRLAEPVVAALDGAIDRAVPASSRRLVLIGYSGGGGAVVLLAARRPDVTAVVSVAGNLATAAWTSHHRITPLSGSLDPSDSARSLGALPQLHLVGARDGIVPRLVADSYARRAAPDACLRILQVPGASHDKGWLDEWPAALREIPDCTAVPPRPAPIR